MIGMLGGTFDPVHLGHISIALEVAERLQLESLQLVPCHLPVHRDPAHGNSEDRLAMLELAVADHPELQINDLEIRRGGQSYTVDTLRQLQPTDDGAMVFIMGSDAYNGFLNWKEPQQILSLASLVICHRPGVPINPDIFAERQVFQGFGLKFSHVGFRHLVSGKDFALRYSVIQMGVSSLLVAFPESGNSARTSMRMDSPRPPVTESFRV